MSMNENPTTIPNACRGLRADCKTLEDRVRAISGDIAAYTNACLFGTNECEARAHAELAIRALEDARMRLGKVIQYSENDGVSIYDK